jgi:MFS family permease
VADSTESLIYAEALRLISGQRDDRDALRARAGTLLSAASLVTAFLGGLALSHFRDTHPHGALTSLAWSALAAFIVVVVLVVVILLPWPWTFVLSPTVLVEDHLGPIRTDPDQLRRFLATTMEEHHGKNKRVLGWLFFSFALASACLIYEAVAWLLIFERG